MGDFGGRLQQLRLAKGITQEELAAQIGVSRHAISKWEANDGKPNSGNLQSLCNYFQKSADYFLRGDNPVSELALEEAIAEDCPAEEAQPLPQTLGDTENMPAARKNTKRFVAHIFLSILTAILGILVLSCGVLLCVMAYNFASIQDNFSDKIYALSVDTSAFTSVCMLMVFFLILFAVVVVLLVCNRKKMKMGR